MPTNSTRFCFVLLAAGSWIALASGFRLLEAEAQPPRIIKQAGPHPTHVRPQDPVQPDDTSKPATTVRKEPVQQMGEREIRLHLHDGSVITGELATSEIKVQTDFGTLVIPVSRVHSFRPGLDSYPELSGKIVQLIEQLGSDDYNTREQSHKALLSYGLSIQRELEKAEDGDNAERKRHLTEIRKALDEMAEEMEDDPELQPQSTWIRGDTVVTTDFTVVGKILQPEFSVQSKYGALTVQLSDIREGDRVVEIAQIVRRSISVSGEYIVQRKFKSSNIRVEKGDKITVKAEGEIVMSPWGSNSTSRPDGGTNYGWYRNNEIPGGALVAKIGGSGEVFLVGSKKTFVAKRNGTLQFGIAMRGEYSGSNYNFPGEYKLKVKVE